MRIMVVEDEAVIALTAVAMLENAGHEVLTPAYSAEEALALGGARPDLALVDINLAGHDEGIALARELRKRFAIPSLFVSGQVEAGRANRDAAIGLLRKPYDTGSLLASVNAAEELLGGGNPPPPPVPNALELFGLPSGHDRN
ncbi:Response regulatory domain-containing protein [Sphingomonas antarctica]|uniref:response regulator n=1 Tax=Sphingomonas antarctica TaxID=2040274 RepID=UPI0039EA554F